MSGDVHVRFRERLGVRFPRATRHVVGAVAQGVPHQVADRDGALLEPARLEADAVRGVDA